jgi:hypothetical protein
MIVREPRCPISNRGVSQRKLGLQLDTQMKKKELVAFISVDKEAPPDVRPRVACLSCIKWRAPDCRDGGSSPYKQPEGLHLPRNGCHNVPFSRRVVLP